MNIQDKITVLYTNGGYGDFKILNNGGLKKLLIIKIIINVWVRHNGGIDLKMRGNPFQINFGATKDTSQNFHLLTQCSKNTQQVHSRTAMAELAQDTFSSTFPCL